MLTTEQIYYFINNNKIEELFKIIEETHYNKIPFNIIYRYLDKNPNQKYRKIINKKYYEFKNYNSYINTYIPDYIKNKSH